jgi:hypothetical protein
MTLSKLKQQNKETSAVSYDLYTKTVNEYQNLTRKIAQDLRAAKINGIKSDMTIKAMTIKIRELKKVIDGFNHDSRVEPTIITEDFQHRSVIAKLNEGLIKELKITPSQLAAFEADIEKMIKSI